MKLLTALLFAVGIISNGNTILSKKQLTAQQLQHHFAGIFFITNDANLSRLLDEELTISNFTFYYKFYMTTVCRLSDRPTLKKYRSRKGYLT